MNWQANRDLVTRDGRPVRVQLSSPAIAEGRPTVTVRIVVDGKSEDIPVDGHDEFAALNYALFVIWERMNELGCGFRPS